MSRLQIIATLLLASVAAGLFQNCGGGWKSAVFLESMSHDLAHIMRTTSFERPNVNMAFESHGLDNPTSYSWSHFIAGVKGGCTERTASTQSSYTISCGQAGDLSVRLTVIQAGREIKMEYDTKLTNPATDNNIPMEVVFEIPNGTDNSPWNKLDSPVETFVGQTLKIVNRDSSAHQLHTSGKPCPHGSSMAGGGSADCVISKTYSREADGLIYDHIDGPKAEFYLVAYSGPELYATNCQSCHNPLDNSERKGILVSEIDQAIQNVPAMKIPQLLNLSLRQKQAIAKALAP